MKGLPPPVERLVSSLSKLPGIGEKTAARLAFFILQEPETYARELADKLIQVKEQVAFCRICFALADSEICHICSLPGREKSRICVVENPQDMLAIENTDEFKGSYHVLHGVISPLEGVQPEDLKIKPLLERLHDNSVSEVLIATNTSIEGEATALYLAKLISPLNITVTRLASGIPMGGDLEYIDKMTLSRAIAGRKIIS